MKYLIVFIHILEYSLNYALLHNKETFANTFVNLKKNINNIADVLCFNGLMFLFSAIIFSRDVVGCPWQVWIYAILGAIFSVIYQITYIKALSIGNVSLT